MSVQPYLFFDGRCEEAIDFYKKTVGAQVQTLMRWKDCPDPTACNPQNSEKVMHAHLNIDGTAVLASDGRCEGKPEQFKGFALALTLDNEAVADKIFNALSEGGQVQMPMSKTFFAPRFGMCADKFGIGWMVMVACDPAKQQQQGSAR